MSKPRSKSAVKPDAERRTNPYTVRYNDDENEAVKAAAAEKALEVASWIRMVSIEAARAQARGRDA